MSEMSNLLSDDRVAHLIEPHDAPMLDILGSTIQFLTSPNKTDGSPCVMRGTIPPGVFVPLHSHADPETFIAISGEVEGLVESGQNLEWVRIKAGDVFHVPGGAKHAFLNRSHETAIQYIVSTSRIGRFFREIGRPVVPGAGATEPPSASAIERLRRTAEVYGHWNGSREENAQVGLVVPTAK